jgi:hypothetical protein
MDDIVKCAYGELALASAGMSPRGKPPIGLTPRWLREEMRVIEICEAIVRYKKAKIPVPFVWLEELRDLCGSRTSENVGGVRDEEQYQNGYESVHYLDS